MEKEAKAVGSQPAPAHPAGWAGAQQHVAPGTAPQGSQMYYFPEDIPNRLTRVETQMVQVMSNMAEMNARLSQTVTKEDLNALAKRLEERDKTLTKDVEKRDGKIIDRQWKLINWLLTIMGILLFALFGLDKVLPALPK